MKHKTQANITINGQVRELLRMVQRQCGPHSELGRRADKILSSGQRLMPARQLQSFVRALGV